MRRSSRSLWLGFSLPSTLTMLVGLGCSNADRPRTAEASPQAAEEPRIHGITAEQIKRELLQGRFRTTGDVIDRSVVVRSKLDVVGLYKATVITGSLTITSTDLEHLTLPFLQVIGGGLQIRSNPRIQNIELPKLLAVGGDAEITANARLAALALPQLAAVGGRVVMSLNDTLTSISMPTLDDVEKGISIGDNPILTLLSTDALVQVRGACDLYRNPHLIRWEMKSLRRIGDRLSLRTNEALRDLTFPSLSELTGALELKSNDELRSIDAPKLITAGAIRISGNVALRDVHLDKLQKTPGDVELMGNIEMASVRLPSLTEISGTLRVHTAFSLKTLNLAALEKVGKSILFMNNQSLPECEIQRLGARLTTAGNLGGGIKTRGNSRLCHNAAAVAYSKTY